MRRWISCSRSLCTIVNMVVVGCLLTATAGADGFRNPPEGGANMGRAGVRLTDADDATAIAHNPANLADLDESSAVVGATFAYSETSYTSPLISEDAKTGEAILPSVFASVPVGDGGCVVGVGLSTPYGQSKEWSEGFSSSFLPAMVPYFAEMKTVNINPTLSTKLSDTVSVGVGIDLLWAELEMRTVAGPVTSEAKTDGYGFGANAGITWDVSSGQRVAVVYRSPISVDCDGSMDAGPMHADLDTELDFPTQVGFGYGIQATDALRIEANVEWIEHSRNEMLRLDSPLVPPSDAVIPQDWDDTWTVGAGVDWQMAPEWVLRTGWFYLPSPVPDTTISPVLPDADENAFSVGLGYKAGVHSVDIGYTLTMVEKRTVAGPLYPAGGEYNSDKQLLAMSYSRTF